VDLGPYETQTTIRLHRQALLREAARERLLASPSFGDRLELLLARTGRFLIDVGTRLEARYASPILSTHSESAKSAHWFLRLPFVCSQTSQAGGGCRQGARTGESASQS
jgi:hypothetical protein